MKLYEQKWRQFLLQEEAPPGTSVDTEDKVIKIPKFRISEKFGEPGSADRQIIESFTSRIEGGNLQEKINSLNAFASDCDSDCIKDLPVNQILANLVFLDCLASVIEDFNPKTGGFLFESLIAALIGGDAAQISAAGGINTPAVDVVDNNGDQWSLKFFFQDGIKYLKGSYNNLVDAVKKGPVNYLIGIKNRESKGGEVLSIDFYKFTVTSKNVKILDPNKDKDSKDEKDKTQINMSLSGIDKVKEIKYARLNFGSKEQLKRVAQNYTGKLGNTMHEMYQQLELLNNNINKYYLGGDKASAMAAANNAGSLKANTEKLSKPAKTN